jgi:hypothetical protein
VFGIEDFSGKRNGNWTLQELLHLNIAARERPSFAGFQPPLTPICDGGYLAAGNAA